MGLETKCPSCPFGGRLESIPADEPWSVDHYQCRDCDATFNTLEEVESLEKTNDAS